MTIDRKKEIFDHFTHYITPERKSKIEKNAAERTRYVTVALEDIFQAHNTSAVLRSCDCFGVQDVHIIEQKHTYTLHESVAKGASQWLTIKRYNEKGANNTERCFAALREKGYRIAATTPHAKDMLIDELQLDKKVALVFGTEQEGLSTYALEHADLFVKIPMYGFTESFNISVSAAICLYETVKRLRCSEYNWRLTEEERIDLQLEWLMKTTPFQKELYAALTSSKDLI
jgi:tRNA (guanosine-2'-O-)-methyltransferase